MHGDIGIAGDGWPHALKPAHPPSARNGSASLTENRPQVRPRSAKSAVSGALLRCGFPANRKTRPRFAALASRAECEQARAPSSCLLPAGACRRPKPLARMNSGELAFQLFNARGACKNVQERARGRCEDGIASGLSDRAACSRSGRAASFIRRNAPLRAA